MISTKNIKIYGDIPDTWIFEYYLNLTEILTGQDVKIRSVFNSKDTIPSMCIYFDTMIDEYKFKDFSSGYQGNGVELVMRLYNITFNEALKKIQNDYKEAPPVSNRNIVFHDRFKVTDYEIRHWNVEDKKYWIKYGIGSRLLEKYNVAPLRFYEMSKEDLEGKTISIQKEYQYIYGYFNNGGELTKIYQPTIKDKKFIKVKNYIQMYDQLTYKTKYLLISSSLKDGLSFTNFGINNIETVAPDSENTLIPKETIEKFINRYTKIIVLFDNDEPGQKSAQKYIDKYNCLNINLGMSKDLSDSIIEYGAKEVKEKVYKLLKDVI
jgi:DNA primase